MAWEERLGPKYLDEPLTSRRLNDPDRRNDDLDMRDVWARAMATGQQLANGPDFTQDITWLQKLADRRAQRLGGDSSLHLRDLSYMHAAGATFGRMVATHGSSTAALQARIDQTWQPYASTNLPHHNGWVRAARSIRSAFQQLTGRQRQTVTPRATAPEQAPPPYERHQGPSPSRPSSPAGPPPSYISEPGSRPVTDKPLPEKPLPDAPLPAMEAAANRIIERDKVLMAPLKEMLAQAEAQLRQQRAQAEAARTRAEATQLAKDLGYSPEALAKAIHVRSDDAPHRKSSAPPLYEQRQGPAPSGASSPTGPPPSYTSESDPYAVTKPLPDAPLPAMEAAANRIIERDKVLMAPFKEMLAQAEAQLRQQQAQAEAAQLAKDLGYSPEVLAKAIHGHGDDAPHTKSATAFLPTGFDRNQTRPHPPARQQDPATGPNANRNPNTAPVPARRGPGR